MDQPTPSPRRVRLEFDVTHAEGWDAHRRRDMIEAFQEAVASQTPRILGLALANCPTPWVSAVKNATIPQALRLSFSDAHGPHVTVRGALPSIPGLKEAISDHVKNENKEFQGHWGVRFLDAIISRLDKDIVRSVEEQTLQEDTDKRMEKWEEALASAVMATLAVRMNTATHHIKNIRLYKGDSVLHYEFKATSDAVTLADPPRRHPNP